MNQPTHADLLEFALRTAKVAGESILPHFRVALDVADKGGATGYDPVTVADRAAETVISEAIGRAYPGHGIRGEEHGWQQGASKYTWVIDPIDGTRSFILGQMHWATLIALHDEAAGQGRCSKFIPASGAATRMFQDLLNGTALDSLLEALHRGVDLMMSGPGRAAACNVTDRLASLRRELSQRIVDD